VLQGGNKSMGWFVGWGKSCIAVTAYSSQLYWEVRIPSYRAEVYGPSLQLTQR
jgi:hypothetical protein